MIRQGYLRVVFPGLEREDYLTFISGAQDGRPEELCQLVRQTLWEMFFEMVHRMN
jgi:hypothetical protein